jgi:hypothetical protein
MGGSRVRTVGATKQMNPGGAWWRNWMGTCSHLVTIIEDGYIGRARRIGPQTQIGRFGFALSYQEGTPLSPSKSQSAKTTAIKTCSIAKVLRVWE